MAGQVMAGMWKRNGYSVVNQIINYQFHYSKEVMYDMDILMLQVGVAYGKWAWHHKVSWVAPKNLKVLKVVYLVSIDFSHEEYVC